VTNTNASPLIAITLRPGMIHFRLFAVSCTSVPSPATAMCSPSLDAVQLEVQRVTQLQPKADFERGAEVTVLQPQHRGLHSSTFQLNLSALYGIGDVRRGCVARVGEGSVWGCSGCVGCLVVSDTAEVELRNGLV
jgi:hypothetical protein